MRWSITVGSVAGTAVRIHVTFLLLLAWIFGANYFSGGPPAAWGALLFVIGRCELQQSPGATGRRHSEHGAEPLTGCPGQSCSTRAKHRHSVRTAMY
jgi:hypothetical protein